MPNEQSTQPSEEALKAIRNEYDALLAQIRADYEARLTEKDRITREFLQGGSPTNIDSDDSDGAISAAHRRELLDRINGKRKGQNNAH